MQRFSFARVFTLINAAVALAALAPAASAASFDCKKAATRIERAVCGDPEVSKLDEELAVEYRRLLARNPAAREQQRDWLRNVRDRCKDVACLREAYQRQLDDTLISLEPDDEEIEAMKKGGR